jgi:hypothetical protein
MPSVAAIGAFLGSSAGLATVVGGGAALGAISSRNATKKSISASERAADTASQQLQDSTGQAREDLFKLFPAAQQNAQQGFQGALNVFNQALPQQSQIFQDGNIAAQNQLLAGIPQFQNAILGNPVDNSQFQATQLQQPNFDFANQQLQSFNPFAPQQMQQMQPGTNTQLTQFPAGNDPRFLSGQPIDSGQPTNRGFNYNDLLTRGFR